MRPKSSFGPSSGSMALIKIAANSTPIRAMPKDIRIRVMDDMFGTAHHRPKEPTAIITENTSIHGLRGPELSAIEPSIGAKTAMKMPVMVSIKAHASCPAKLSPITAEVKYGAKINVTSNVWKGWLAQSKDIHPQIPFFDAYWVIFLSLFVFPTI